MKTNKMNEKLEQAKNEIAKELNYKDWETCINDQPNYRIEGLMDKVALRYHELMSADEQERINKAYELGCRTAADDILNRI